MRRPWIRIALLVLVVGGTVMLASCISFSPFMIREAPLPQDWPELTPVGAIQIQRYPAYRAARVTARDADGQTREMFGVLFRHIKDAGIPMTAPVDIGYDPNAAGGAMSDMAFLYRTPDEGTPGPAGAVDVRDIPPATFVSLGVRGSYAPDAVATHVDQLRDWLAAQDDFRPTGPPRYLGYNSPFVPSFLRYGEVQIPVRETDQE